MEGSDILAVVAAIAAPACAWLAMMVRLLYSDLKSCHARYEALLRETLVTLASFEVSRDGD